MKYIHSVKSLVPCFVKLVSGGADGDNFGEFDWNKISLVLYTFQSKLSAMSKFGRVDKPRTHEESRAIVCCVCSKKVKQDKHSIKIVSDKLSDLVRKFVFSGYSIHNPLHPTALCASCRLTLSAMDKVIYSIQGVHFHGLALL